MPDADLAYLPEGTNDFDDYVEAVGWAQDFAMANRQIMPENIKRTHRLPIGSRFPQRSGRTRNVLGHLKVMTGDLDGRRLSSARRNAPAASAKR